MIYFCFLSTIIFGAGFVFYQAEPCQMKNLYSGRSKGESQEKVKFDLFIKFKIRCLEHIFNEVFLMSR
jgi:hypothetical protein